MNIWRIIYLNCGEIYEDMIDHRSYTHNLSSCEIKPWKKIQAWTGFEPMPMTSARVNCSQWLFANVWRGNREGV